MANNGSVAFSNRRFAMSRPITIESWGYHKSAQAM